MELKPFDDTHRNQPIYLSRYLDERKIREEKKQLNVWVPRDLKDSFKLIVQARGLKLEDAVEQAVFDWVRVNAPETQIQVNVFNPVSVTVNKVTQIEVREARDELQRLTRVLEKCDEPYRDGFKRDLSKWLKKALILEERTRDPELTKIIAQAEACLT